MIVVGYVLIEGRLRTGWMYSSVPETVYTPTECVCTIHPSGALITESRAAYLENLQLSSNLREEFQVNADKLFDAFLWGADGVFPEYQPAFDFWQRWFQGRLDVQLFELSLPAELLPGFLDAVAPPVENAVLSGKYLAARGATLPLANTTILGFEVWGVQPWGDMHTSVRYGVRDGLIHQLGATFNEWGLLPTLELAKQAAEQNNNAEGGAVGDNVWFPVQIARVPVTEGRESYGCANS